MTMRFLGALLAVIITVFMAACGESKSAPEAAAVPAAATRQTPTPPQPRENYFEASGPLVVENQVDVASQRESVVAKTMVEPGAHVTKGQLLGLLDDQQVTAELESARAKTRSIESDLKNWEAEARVLHADSDRAQQMWEAGLITKEQMDHAHYKGESGEWDVKRVRDLLVSAQQTERSVELELEKTRIRAPFSGIVARRYVRVGQKVALGDRLFWVTAEAPLRVRFALPEKFLGWVQRGSELALTLPDVPEEKHPARVVEMSPVVDPSSGTIDVVAEVVGPRGELRPGRTVTIRIPSPQ